MPAERELVEICCLDMNTIKANRITTLLKFRFLEVTHIKAAELQHNNIAQSWPYFHCGSLPLGKRKLAVAFFNTGFGTEKNGKNTTSHALVLTLKDIQKEKG